MSIILLCVTLLVIWAIGAMTRRHVYHLKNEAGSDIYFNKGNSPRPFRDRSNFLTAHLIACSQEAKALQSEPGFLEWVEGELEYHWQRYSWYRRRQELILCARPSIFRRLVARRAAEERLIIELASEVAALNVRSDRSSPLFASAVAVAICAQRREPVNRHRTHFPHAKNASPAPHASAW